LKPEWGVHHWVKRIITGEKNLRFDDDDDDDDDDYNK
jgi:hypothetical protein